MKKTVISLAFVAALSAITVACKKSSKSSDPTPDPTPVTPTGTNFSVNGTSQGSNLTIVKGATNNNTVYEFIVVGSPWGIGLYFNGGNPPASGTYSLEDSTSTSVPAGQCLFVATGPNNQFGKTKSGVVTVSSGASSTITFNNVLAQQTDLSGNVTATYTLSGTVKY